MKAEGHILFSIACAILAKKIEITPQLAAGEWWHIIPAALTTCLLPDIDHPSSFLGRRLKLLSTMIARLFGHRGFTHSLLAISIIIFLLNTHFPNIILLPSDILQGMVIGYLSHLLADMLTPAGVPLLWPYRKRFCLPILRPNKFPQHERWLSIALAAYALIWHY